MKALVLVADALHLGYVGAYGNDWIETPAFDELAAAGVVFDQHVSDRPEAVGARRAWRTGHYQFPLPDGDAPAAAVDLVALLRQKGVRTSLVIDGSRPHVADFAAGWDHSDVVSPDGDATPMELTLEAVQAALDRHAGDEHWLVWVELATLRPPWDVPDNYLGRYFAADTGEEDEAEDEEESLELLPHPEPGLIGLNDDETFARLQRTYAGAVSYLDAGLGLLLEELNERGLLDDMLLVVTSDHGLPLGEHGAVGPARPWLHDELVHVPLLVRLPGAAEAGRRVPALTQPVDLAPTLLDAFGVALPPVHGYSLLPLARGTAERVREYAAGGLRVGDGLEWALRTPEWAVLLPVYPTSYDAPRPPQLYVKPDDRWEVNDLRQHHLEWAERLEATLREFVSATRRPGPLRPPPLPAEETNETGAESHT